MVMCLLKLQYVKSKHSTPIFPGQSPARFPVDTVTMQIILPNLTYLSFMNMYELNPPRKFPPVHFIVCCFIIFSLFHALFSPRIIFPYVPCCCSKRWERKLTLYPLTSSAISCFYVSTTKYRGSFLFDLSFSCKHFLSGSSQSSFFFCPFILLTAIHNMHTFSEKNKHFVYFSFICLFSLSFLFLLPLLFLCFFLSFLSSSTQLSLPA